MRRTVLMAGLAALAAVVVPVPALAAGQLGPAFPTDAGGGPRSCSWWGACPAR